MSTRFTRALVVCLAAACACAAQSAGTVSAADLRHSIPGKVTNLIRDAFESSHGSPAREQERLRKVLDDPEAAPYALKRLGVLHIDSGDIRAAVTELESAASELPWDAEAHALFAYALHLAGNFELSVQQVERARSLDPKQPVAHVVLAYRALDRKDREGALKHLWIAVPRLPNARLLIGALYKLGGKTQEAERQFRIFRESAGASGPSDMERVERWLAVHSSEEN